MQPKRITGRSLAQRPDVYITGGPLARDRDGVHRPHATLSRGRRHRPYARL